MRVRKAVITAAGRDQNQLPLQRFVDVGGDEKSALQIVVEEVLAAEVEQIAIVVRPGDQTEYAEAAGPYARQLSFLEQTAPRGYGDALFRASEFVGDEPFLHLVGDHLYLSRLPQRCARQLVEAAQVERCAISAVQATRESLLRYYGTVGGRRVEGRKDFYQIERLIEKPTPTQAEQTLIVPGLRQGYYLCLFGMHVLTPTVMTLLGRALASTSDEAPIPLTPALDALARKERYLALEVQGMRFNIGVKYGSLLTQLALALHGQDCEEVLARVVDLLASMHVRGQP